MKRSVGFVLLGIVFGIFYAKFIFLGAILTLATWGIGGILVGVLSNNRKESLWQGAIYGFVVSFAFLVVDYNGHNPIIRVLFPFALLSLFGALCGIVLGFAGNLLKKFIRKNN